MELFDLRNFRGNSAADIRLINDAIEAISAGGVVAFPTDTVWGIGTCSQKEAVVDRLFDLKKRPATQPLSYLIPSVEALETIFEEEVPAHLENAAQLHWPGATTLIVDAPPEILPAARRGAPGVGLRIPDHETLRYLLTGLPPLANTSANLSGSPPFKNSEEILEAFGDQLDVMLLMNPLPSGAASQVLCIQPHGEERVLRAR